MVSWLTVSIPPSAHVLVTAMDVDLQYSYYSKDCSEWLELWVSLFQWVNFMFWMGGTVCKSVLLDENVFLMSGAMCKSFIGRGRVLNGRSYGWIWFILKVDCRWNKSKHTSMPPKIQRIHSTVLSKKKGCVDWQKARHSRVKKNKNYQICEKSRWNSGDKRLGKTLWWVQAIHKRLGKILMWVQAIVQDSAARKSGQNIDVNGLLEKLVQKCLVIPTSSHETSWCI